MVEILSQDQVSPYSKVFRVDAGFAVVISSFNFACEQQDEFGEVVKNGDCAILHKIELGEKEIGTLNGCTSCSYVLDGVDVNVANSEPVVVCGDLWVHNSDNNLSVLTVPGYYMFELCGETSVGSVTIKVQELTLNQAALLPRGLIHGE